MKLTVALVPGKLMQPGAGAVMLPAAAESPNFTRPLRHRPPIRGAAADRQQVRQHLRLARAVRVTAEDG